MALDCCNAGRVPVGSLGPLEKFSNPILAVECLYCQITVNIEKKPQNPNHDLLSIESPFRPHVSCN